MNTEVRWSFRVGTAAAVVALSVSACPESVVGPGTDAQLPADSGIVGADGSSLDLVAGDHTSTADVTTADVTTADVTTADVTTAADTTAADTTSPVDSSRGAGTPGTDSGQPLDTGQLVDRGGRDAATASCLGADALDVIDLHAVRVSGAFWLNGAPFPADDANSGGFYLVDVETGDRVFMGWSENQTYSILVTAGVYDVVYDYYDSSSDGSLVPHNNNAVIQRDLVVASDTTYDVDMRAHRMSGAFKLNGTLFPSDDSNSGGFYLVDQSTADRLFMGWSEDQTYSVLAVSGTHDVVYDYYDSSSDGSLVPHNNHAVLFCVDL